MNRLSGKIALVTGASRGIGKGIALRLAKEGALVAVHYGSRFDAAKEVIDAIEAEGGKAFAVGANLESVAGAHKLLQLLDEELQQRMGFNQFDILVNNAGAGSQLPFEEITENAFDDVFAVNVKAPFFLVQQSLSRLRDGGRIINISSGVTRVSYPPIIAYSMTKGAINTFTLHLANTARTSWYYCQCGFTGTGQNGNERVISRFSGRTRDFSGCGCARANWVS